MDFAEGSNTDIVNYFSKFEGNYDYDRYLRELKDLSIFRIRGYIELGDHKIPDVGPSEKITSFPDTIENWSQMEINEIRNIIKLFDAGEIESLEEAILLIEILKRNGKNPPPVLDRILSDMRTGKITGDDNYEELLNFESNENDSIIYGNLWKFLMTIVS